MIPLFADVVVVVIVIVVIVVVCNSVVCTCILQILRFTITVYFFNFYQTQGVWLCSYNLIL